MQKWEYATLGVVCGTVLSITTSQHGQTVVGQARGITIDGPSLFDTLSRMGPDGWEVCSTVPDREGSSGWRFSTVVLKRLAS
jgi:hypothetical protein